MICMSDPIVQQMVCKQEGTFATWAAVILNTMVQMRSASKLRDGAAIIL
jgi:hypothetical protein